MLPDSPGARPWILPIVTLVAGVFLGVTGANAWPSLAFWEEEFSDHGEVREDSDGYPLINPLLECELGPEFIAKNRPKPTRMQMDQIISRAKQEGKITFASIYYRDLNNGPWMGINEKEKFFPASLLKLPILIHWLQKADRDPTVLQQTVLFNGPEVEVMETHFPPEKRLEVGATYTVEELLERAIRYSDNGATMTLAAIMPSDALETLMTQLHMDYAPDSDGAFMNVRNYSGFLRILYNASLLSNEQSERALELLTRTTFTQGMTAKLPPSIPVAHKFGERASSTSNEKQLHDCGIVYLPEDPYLFCAMTRGTNQDHMAEVIADLSKSVYDTMTNTTE